MAAQTIDDKYVLNPGMNKCSRSDWSTEWIWLNNLIGQLNADGKIFWFLSIIMWLVHYGSTLLSFVHINMSRWFFISSDPKTKILMALSYNGGQIIVWSLVNCIIRFIRRSNVMIFLHVHINMASTITTHTCIHYHMHSFHYQPTVIVGVQWRTSSHMLVSF